MLKSKKLISSGTSIVKAARRNNIPASTLQLYLRRCDAKPHGKKPLLSATDEQTLVKYAMFMTRVGFPVTAKWLMATASHLARERYF